MVAANGACQVKLSHAPVNKLVFVTVLARQTVLFLLRSSADTDYVEILVVAVTTSRKKMVITKTIAT